MFPGGKKGMKDLMKQAQKMQKDLQKAQDESKKKIVEGTSGGGMVKVKINGEYRVKELKIDKEAVDPEDVEMLEDLVIAAFNEARSKIEKSNSDNLSGITGGLNIPGL